MVSQRSVDMTARYRPDVSASGDSVRVRHPSAGRHDPMACTNCHLVRPAVSVERTQRPSAVTNGAKVFLAPTLCLLLEGNVQLTPGPFLVAFGGLCRRMWPAMAPPRRCPHRTLQRDRASSCVALHSRILASFLLKMRTTRYAGAHARRRRRRSRPRWTTARCRPTCSRPTCGGARRRTTS